MVRQIGTFRCKKQYAAKHLGLTDHLTRNSVSEPESLEIKTKNAIMRKYLRNTYNKNHPLVGHWNRVQRIF